MNDNRLTDAINSISNKDKLKKVATLHDLKNLKISIFFVLFENEA